MFCSSAGPYYIANESHVKVRRATELGGRVLYSEDMIATLALLIAHRARATIRNESVAL